MTHREVVKEVISGWWPVVIICILFVWILLAVLFASYVFAQDTVGLFRHKPSDFHGVRYIGAHDGDTVMFDLTPNPPYLPDVFRYITVRLNGINAPELVSKCPTAAQRDHEHKLGEEAANQLRRWLREADEKGLAINLLNASGDKYFRLDAVVTIEGQNESLNSKMVRLGLARPYDGKTNKDQWYCQ